MICYRAVTNMGLRRTYSLTKAIWLSTTQTRPPADRRSGWKDLAMFRRFTLAATAGMILLASQAAAQQQDVNVHVDVHVDLGGATHVVMPQSRAWAVRPTSRLDSATVSIDAVKAHVRILEQTASTTLNITLRNSGRSQAEAVVLLPVPNEAAVSGFTFWGTASEPTAELLPRDEARRIYDDIVRQVRDPALLEFAGYNLIRSSVFPVEAGGTQQVRLTYENVLETDGDRIDYILPRSESLLATVPWQITVEIESKSPISMVYSPSHDVVEDVREARRIKLHVERRSAMEPGAFRLSHLLERNGVTASMFAYPDPKVGGGYFLLMAGLPATIDDAKTQLQREPRPLPELRLNPKIDDITHPSWRNYVDRLDAGMRMVARLVDQLRPIDPNADPLDDLMNQVSDDGHGA